MFLGSRRAFPFGMHGPGTLLENRYRLGPLLGEGGMAVVYRAHDETLDREVAVKILRPQFASDDDFVRRFAQEARNAASLSHPSIAPIFDTGIDGGLQYIVMQLVDGSDLERVLAEHGRLAVGEALRITTEVADALEAAHDAGIIHRDVKPGNILLTSHGDVRVVDFGIARALGDVRTTQAGLLLGSVQYCSPEQVLGEPVGPASDVYSLGIVMYELLTGRRPFDGAVPAAVALRRLHEDPARPSMLSSELPIGVDALVMRALERDPADRYASASAMAGAIRTFWRAHRDARDSDPRPAYAGGLPVIESPSALTVVTEAPAAVRGPSPAMTHGGLRGAHPGRGVAVAQRPHRRHDRPLWTLPLPLIPLAAILFVAMLFSPLIGAFVGDRGGVLGETGTPGASTVAALPSVASSSPSSSAAPTPTPTAVPAQPTATPERTLPPATAPTPAPTVHPTTPPVVPPRAATTPTAIVARFYELVEAHEFDAAAALWTSRMRRQYPPYGYIDGRFARTTRIDLLRNDLVAVDAGSGTAVVAVDLIEYRTDEPSPRRFIGRWDLVLTRQGWRMDEPHF